MNFDKDYKEFVEHWEKRCAARPVINKLHENTVKLFLAYLNKRYKKGFMILG